MDCTQVGFSNTCELINNYFNTYYIHYNDPLVIVGWMIFAIIAWQIKGFIWSLIKWILKLFMWLLLLVVGLSIVSALLQAIFI
jgi:hypothetical protein